jgi:hypothetical protein
MIRARRLNLEETAISSTCVRLTARPVALHLINNDCSLSFAILVLKKVGMQLNGTNVLYARSLPLSYLLKCEMLVKIAS